MAITCDSTLAGNAACFDCGIPKGMRKAVIIALLCQIAGVEADAVSLLADSSCYQCQIPAGMQPSVIIYLLCAIANPATCVTPATPTAFAYSGEGETSVVLTWTAASDPALDFFVQYRSAPAGPYTDSVSFPPSSRTGTLNTNMFDGLALVIAARNSVSCTSPNSPELDVPPAG